jgi:hypothetical protein
MFRRLILEDSAALFTLAAFATALSIYLTIGWRALRMKRPVTERFANLPFATATPCAAPAAPRPGAEPSPSSPLES